MAHQIDTPGVIRVRNEFAQHVGNLETGPVAKDGDRGAQLVHQIGASMARREVFFEDDPFLGG